MQGPGWHASITSHYMKGAGSRVACINHTMKPRGMGDVCGGYGLLGFRAARARKVVRNEDQDRTGKGLRIQGLRPGVAGVGFQDSGFETRGSRGRGFRIQGLRPGVAGVGVSGFRV